MAAALECRISLVVALLKQRANCRPNTIWLRISHPSGKSRSGEANMKHNPISIIDLRLKTLHDYWLRKRGPRIAPSRADMKPNELKFILAQVYLLEVVGVPQRFRFRLAGTVLENGYGGQLTGKFVDEIDVDGVGNLILSEYERVTKDALPVARSWNYTKDDGTDWNTNT
jgi:hypothetical protein